MEETTGEAKPQEEQRPAGEKPVTPEPIVQSPSSGHMPQEIRKDIPPGAETGDESSATSRIVDEIRAESANTALAVPTGGVAENKTQKEQEIEDYVKKIVKAARERFFDTDQGVTLGLDNPDHIPGFVTMVAVTNPEQDLEVVVSYLKGLSSNIGGAIESIGGQEVQITYRQLGGSRKVPRMLRRRMSGYEYGNIVLPGNDQGVHWKRKPYSLKSTMRPVDVEKWEDGDTSAAGDIGYYNGEKSIDPTKADYEAILDAVSRGAKNEQLTKKSAEHFTEKNSTSHFKTKVFVEKSRDQAQEDLDHRVEEIERGQRLAVDSARYGNEMSTKAIGEERDHASGESLGIAEERIREVATGHPQDTAILAHTANELSRIGVTLNTVRTLLESDDPNVKAQLKGLTTDNQEVQFTPKEMHDLTRHIAEHPKFGALREKTGFSDGAIYGISLDAMTDPNQKAGRKFDRIHVSQETKREVLETLGFLRSGESLADRIDRMAGRPVYESTESGEQSGRLRFFRHDPNTGETIIWHPENVNNSGNIRITSPLFGPHVIAFVDTHLRIGSDGEQDRLEQAGNIEDIAFRFEGSSESIGNAMVRLSKNTGIKNVDQKNSESSTK